MRIPILLLAGCAALAAQANPTEFVIRAAKPWPAPPAVNLDRPGVLEAIERDDPERYQRILQVLELAQSATCDHMPQVMKVDLAVTSYSCNSAMFLTSLPAKRHLNFTLDGTAYVSNVVQWRLADGRLHKADDRR